MTGLECGHKFCAKCWADYLTSKIIDEGMGQTISCAAFGCDILVDDTTVMWVDMHTQTNTGVIFEVGGEHTHYNIDPASGSDCIFSGELGESAVHSY